MKNSDLLLRIESSMPFLSKSEKKVGEYILNNPKKVAHMSTQSLSTACQVSEPTLIRFTRKLGFNGYREFKLQLSANLVSKQLENTPVRVDINDSAQEIYEKLTAFTIASLKSTVNTIDGNDLETAANYIYLASQKKHQIFLSGMGASTVLIKEFQIKMMRLNIQTVFYEDIHLRLEACTNLKKDDLFICFTTLGSSKENYELIDIAHSRNAKIIIITQYGNSKTSEKADITLYTSVIENNLRLASQTSIVLQSMIIDTIFLIIALKDYKTISKDVQETKELFHRLGHTVI
ncbi:MurR/RpiR family transcriptional regulator [Faecalitalea cylindroides]|uniref:MurR/RpiR family transcriptional regulator n=1 Tax=Faecalitalea cylindroides TaxID=39483 RepID=UPI00248FEE34|nr:MurR/RpiR family transcriptional regulator [Faecalitalea cylindroides]